MGTMGVLVGVLMGSCAPHGDAVGPLIAAPASPYFFVQRPYFVFSAHGLIFYSAFLFLFQHHVALARVVENCVPYCFFSDPIFFSAGLGRHPLNLIPSGALTW